MIQLEKKLLDYLNPKNVFLRMRLWVRMLNFWPAAAYFLKPFGSEGVNRNEKCQDHGQSARWPE